MNDLPTMWMPEHAVEGVRLLDRLKKQSRADFSSAPFGPGDVPYVPQSALIESQAALAAATEEQSRAWALLTGERWTQTRAEGSLVEAAARMRDQLAAANARAETADRQIAVHEASAKEQLSLSLAVGAAMREVTQTEIGSGNHAAARARWEEAKKKFAAFQLAPLAGPLERIEAERDALRAQVEELLADGAGMRMSDAPAAPAPTPADAKETPAAVPGLVFGEPDPANAPRQDDPKQGA